MGVVGRRLGAGDTGAGLKENLRRLRRFGGSRWLYRWFWLVWLGWPGLVLGPSSSCAGLDVWVSSYTLVQAFFWWSSWADPNISALDLLEQSRVAG